MRMCAHRVAAGAIAVLTLCTIGVWSAAEHHQLHPRSAGGQCRPNLITEYMQAAEYSPIKLARVKLAARNASFWFAFPDAKVLEETHPGFSYPGGYWYDDLYKERPEALLRGLCSRLCLEQLLDMWPCHAHPRGFFLNIGSNLGLFTLLGAAKGCHAIAIEGCRSHKNHIDISRELNGFDVTAIHAAAGHHFCEVAFGDGALGRTAEGDVKAGAVPMITADSVVEQHVRSVGGTLAGIMIDVEGFEQEVLLGAAQSIRTMQPGFIIIEVWTVRDGDIKTSFPGLDLLQESGYKLLASSNGTAEVGVVTSVLDPQVPLSCYDNCGNGRCCLTDLLAVRYDLVHAVLQLDFASKEDIRIGRRRLGHFA